MGSIAKRMVVMAAEESEKMPRAVTPVHMNTSYTQFLEFCCFTQGLTAVFLIISGACHILWIRGLAEEDPGDPHLSTFQNLCWMIISCGVFLLLWTVSGWIIYSVRSISLSVTCGVSNFSIVILLYFISGGGSYHQQQLQSQFHSCFIIIFCVFFTISQV